MSENPPDPVFEPADESASWPVHGTEDLYHDAWVIGFRADTISAPNDEDHRFRRLILETPGAAIVVAIDDEDRVVVVRQYRHPARAHLIELPAGLLDVPGEDPLVTAQRELREEAALAADHWEHLVTVYPSPGISEERQHIYLATGLHPVPRDFDPEHEEAEMQLTRIPFTDLLQAVRDGRVQDGPLVVGLLAVADRRS